MPEEPPEPAYEPEPTPNVPHVDLDVPGKTTPVGGDAPPTPTPPAPAANGEAEAVWEAATKKIMELNPMVYFYVKDTRGAALDGDTLTVEFPATQESSMNGMRAERNLKIAKDAIEAVRPKTALVFRLAALLDKNEEKLKELFGSSLTIK